MPEDHLAQPVLTSAAMSALFSINKYHYFTPHTQTASNNSC